MTFKLFTPKKNNLILLYFFNERQNNSRFIFHLRFRRNTNVEEKEMSMFVDVSPLKLINQNMKGTQY